MELGKARVFFFMAFMCGGYRALYCLKRGIQLALGIFASLCVRGSYLACGRGKGLGGLALSFLGMRALASRVWSSGAIPR